MKLTLPLPLLYLSGLLPQSTKIIIMSRQLQPGNDSVPIV